MRAAGDAEGEEGGVMTVRGPLDPARLGAALVHEHVMCDFIGAEAVNRSRYRPDEVVETMAPFLEDVVRRGIAAFMDCTPAFIGRDVAILRRLSDISGIHILTNTGYYGAAGDKFVPSHAYAESAAELAARWAAEWRGGIDGTGIRPGFIKTGVDGGPLSAIDRKLVQASALAHLQTGLPIACHTGEARAALETLEAVTSAGVASEALIVVHADAIPGAAGNDAVLARIAAAGAWVEIDGIGPDTTDRHVALILSLLRRGFLSRMLLSHDAGWYSVGEPGGGSIRPFTTVSDVLLPALKKAITEDTGLSALLGGAERAVRAIMTENPARAFTIGVKRRR